MTGDLWSADGREVITGDAAVTAREAIDDASSQLGMLPASHADRGGVRFLGVSIDLHGGPGTSVSAAEPPEGVEPYTGDPLDERDRLKPGGDMAAPPAFGVSLRGSRINATGRTAYESLRAATYAALGQPEPPSRRESAIDHVLAAVALAGAAAPNRLSVDDGIFALLDLGVTSDELAASRARITGA